MLVYARLSGVISPDDNKIYSRRVEPDVIVFVELDLTTGKERELLRRAKLGALNLSPDGRYILTPNHSATTGSGAVLIIPVAGGEPLQVMSLPAERGVVSPMGWAADSRSFFVRRRNPDQKTSAVWQVFSDGSTARKLHDLEDKRLERVAVRLSPDGRHAAFMPEPEGKASAQSEVWVLENFLPSSALENSSTARWLAQATSRPALKPPFTAGLRSHTLKMLSIPTVRTYYQVGTVSAVNESLGIAFVIDISSPFLLSKTYMLERSLEIAKSGEPLFPVTTPPFLLTLPLLTLPHLTR